MLHPRFSGRGGRPENESSGAWAFGLAKAGFPVFRPRPEVLSAGFWREARRVLNRIFEFRKF